MVPTVNQHLAAIRHTIAKTLIPALDGQAEFAREQAGLMLACLDWLIDVQGSEYRYARLEHAEWLAVLTALAALAPAESAGTARTTLAAGGSPPLELAALQDQIVALKTAAEHLFIDLGATSDGAAAAAAKQLITEACRRQSEREQAWVRMTGFGRPGAPGLEAVFAAQESRSQR